MNTSRPRPIINRFFRSAASAELLLIILLSAGCVSMGREFPTTQISMIKIGETTQQEIRNHFGPPWRIGIENGDRTWTYGHYYYSLFGQGSTEDLVIRFNRQGIVASYVFNTTKHKQGSGQ